MARRAALALIALYQRLVSPFLPGCCRFEPTCSCYAAGAIERFGLPRGLMKALLRLLKCHPLHPGGYDPVN
jgi:putative membrane protein insertion efficiency factor